MILWRRVFIKTVDLIGRTTTKHLHASKAAQKQPAAKTNENLGHQCGKQTRVKWIASLIACEYDGEGDQFRAIKHIYIGAITHRIRLAVASHTALNQPFFVSRQVVVFMERSSWLIKQWLLTKRMLLTNNCKSSHVFSPNKSKLLRLRS